MRHTPHHKLLGWRQLPHPGQKSLMRMTGEGENLDNLQGLAQSGDQRQSADWNNASTLAPLHDQPGEEREKILHLPDTDREPVVLLGCPREAPA